MPAKPASPAAAHQLKTTLRHLRPPIWRRIQVPAGIRRAQPIGRGRK